MATAHPWRAGRERRGARLRRAVAAVAAVLSLAGCAVGSQRDPHVIPEEDIPFDVSPPSSSATTTSTTTSTTLATDVSPP